MLGCSHFLCLWHYCSSIKQQTKLELPFPSLIFVFRPKASSFFLTFHFFIFKPPSRVYKLLSSIHPFPLLIFSLLPLFGNKVVLFIFYFLGFLSHKFVCYFLEVCFHSTRQKLSWVIMNSDWLFLSAGFGYHIFFQTSFLFLQSYTRTCFCNR